MEEIKLEAWQSVTIQALAAQRERVVQQAQDTINGLSATIERYAKEWAAGQDGPFEFSQRPDGLYLVSKDDETGMAPAA